MTRPRTRSRALAPLLSPLLSSLLLAACSRPAPPSVDPVPQASVAVASSAPASATTATPVTTAPRAPAPAPPLPATATTCPTSADGPACTRFATAEDAFRWVLAHDPAILAIGEAHAQKGTENVASATKRFTESLLPVLKDRASDLLVEAWAGDPKCQKAVQAVASAQAPVKEAQAATNPNEYLTMGVRAKALGIVPDLLRPSCDDYASLQDAGADVVTASLALIKRLTQETATRLHRRNLELGNGKTVVTYGGAMHNDLAPSEALRPYSFGAELLAAAAGRYVELDLIVPSYVKDTDAWRKLPWYAAYVSDSHAKDKPTLYRVGERSFVLVFAEKS